MSDLRGANIAVPGRRLESWKEIAAHLQRDVRTVQRWEQREGLPVHRHLHAERVTVYAYAGELDEWLCARQPDEPGPALLPASRPPGFRFHPRVRTLIPLGAACVLLAVAASVFFRARGPAAPGNVTRLFAGYTSEGAARIDFPAVGPPTEMLLSPDGRTLYVASYERNTVEIIDLARRIVTRRLAVDGHPSALAASPDGAFLYIGSMAGPLVICRVRDGSVTRANVGTPVGDLAVTGDGRYVYLALQYSGLRRMVAATRALESLPSVGCPMFLAADKARGRIYVSYQCQGPGGMPGHDAVEALDAATGRRVWVASGPPQVGGPIAVSPNGAYVWVNGINACSAASYDHAGCPAVPSVVVNAFLAADGTLLRSLALPFDRHPWRIAFLPDSAHAVIGGAQPRVLDARRFAVTEVIRGSIVGVPQFTPDGRQAWVLIDGRPTLVALTSEAEDLPADAMQHHWRADGTADDAAAELHGTPRGSAAYEPGVVGQAFSLDGANGWIDMGEHRKMAEWNVGDATAVAWVRFREVGRPMAIIDAAAHATTPGGGWRLGKGADDRLEFCVARAGDGACPPQHGTTVRSAAPVQKGRWYHVAVTHRSGELSLFVDGALEDRASPERFPESGAFRSQRIGAGADGEHLDGLIDEVAFYGRALTVAEIQHLARRAR